jgi:diguanylate cyclase (GGDEF)-like protein
VNAITRREAALRQARRAAEHLAASASIPGPPGAVDRDVAGGDRDQAGERDKVAGERDRAGDDRDEAAEQRDEAADDRDHAGQRRDQAGDARDHAADLRDDVADERDHAAELAEMRAGGGVALDAANRSALARREAAVDRRQASRDRQAGADERVQAEADRDTALADRGAGAGERAQAEIDRATALADRGASARERASAFIDDLTGVYLRGPGMLELEREMARARRSQQPLILAFVDVDQLKATNDSRGHAAGDRLLLDVADSFKRNLRSHDLIIRYGGDEFVCAFSSLDLAEATRRLAVIAAAVAEAPEHGSVTAGLAQLRTGDSPEGLIARADAALYRERVRRAAASPGSPTIGEARSP